MPPEELKELNVAVVGVSPHHAVPNRIGPLLRDPRVKLVALADPDPDRLNAVCDGVGNRTGRRPRAFADANALIASGLADAIVLVVPTAAHAPLAGEALRHRLHVLVEKPFTVTLAEAKEVVALARAHGRVLHVAYQKQYGRTNPHMVAELLPDRTVVHGRWLAPHGTIQSLPPAVYADATSGGILLDRLSHTIERSLPYLPGRPCWAYAWGSRDTGVAVLGDRFRAEDTAFGVVLTDQGGALVVHGAYDAPVTGEQHLITVHGSHGTLHDPVPGPEQDSAGLAPYITVDGDEAWNGPSAVLNPEMNARCVDHFVAACLGVTEPQSLDQILLVQAIIDALRASMSDQAHLPVAIRI